MTKKLFVKTSVVNGDEINSCLVNQIEFQNLICRSSDCIRFILRLAFKYNGMLWNSVINKQLMALE